MSGSDASGPAAGPGTDVDPNNGHDAGHYVFWADEVADRIEARRREERGESGVAGEEPWPDASAEPIVIKGGISPSGVPHLGNANEIMRGYFVAEALRDRGWEVRQVFTSDDRDPLRKVPRKLADLDGTIVGLDAVDAGAIGRNLGKPYTDVPDPFGCCDSYGEHFSRLIADSASALGVPIEVLSTTDLYEDGTFEAATYHVLERTDRAREVLAQYQDSVDADYVPFNPICESCGKITYDVTDVDLDAGAVGDAGDLGDAGVVGDAGDVGDGGDMGEVGAVTYRCSDIEAGNRIIEGCDHEGVATLREGKLPWRFEWPAQWSVLGVDFEPFGKDHAEGSWPSGQHIAREVFDAEPPEPLVYEWFTLNGEPFSSSAGNVILVSDVVELVEPEVLRYFFSLDPRRARDFDVERLDRMTEEFDRLERAFYGEVSGDEDERMRAQRVYPDLIRATVGGGFPTGAGDGRTSNGDPDLVGAPQRPVTDPAERAEVRALVEDTFGDRVRLPYTFAAVLGMFEGGERREEVARREGHLPDGAPAWAIAYAMDRVERASNWAARTDNEYNYRVVRDRLPAVEVDAATEPALAHLADLVEDGVDGETLQGEIYETAKRNDVDIGSLFETGYRLFLDESQGPQLGPFLARLDREFVADRLRRER